MVKTIISCADIHFRNMERLTELKSVLEKFISDCKSIVERDGKDSVRIVVCGDLVESKINISNECTIALGWFLRELNTICKTIVVAGNHDLILSNLQRLDSLTPIFQIGDFENVIFADAETEYQSGCFIDDNIVWCLYSIFDDYNRPDIDEMKISNSDKTYVGLIHADINGAMDFEGRITENGVDSNTFEGLNFVIAGHIHKRQEIKKNGVKIVYCSSVYQRNIGETVTGHGYVVWNVEKGKYDFVDIQNTDYGFYKFSINDITDIENDKEELLNL